MNSYNNPTTKSKFTVTNFKPSPSFLNQSEYEQLKMQGEALDCKIKLRKEYESKYQQLKLSQVEKEIEDIKYKNQIANKRNEDLLNSIQKDIYNCYQVNKISSHSKLLKDKETKKYSDYLQYQLAHIRNEFHMKILAKQNELHGIKSVLENQCIHNEKVLKMENDYSLKIAKMNDELREKIKMLHDKNKKIEDDRQSILLNYKVMEEKSKETFKKIFEAPQEEFDVKNNEKLPDNKSFEIEEGLVEEILRKIKNKDKLQEKEKEKETVYDFEEKEKKIEIKPNLDTQQENKFEPESNPKREGTTRMSKEIYSYSKNEKEKQITVQSLPSTTPKFESDKSSSIDLSLSKQSDVSKLKIKNEEKISEPLKKSIPAKRLSHKHGPLDNIRIEKKKRDSRAASPKNSVTNINRSDQLRSLSKDKGKKFTGEKIIQENLTIINYDKLNDKIEQDEFSMKQNTNRHADKKKEENEIFTVREKIDSNSQEIKKNNSFYGNEKSKDISEISLNQKTDVQKKSPIEILLEEKPDLIKVPKEFKILVVKKIISQIDRNSKGVKPNNASTYVYQSKHMVSSNKPSSKSKFYEILLLSQETEVFSKEITNINTDSLINLLLEILNSNSNLNLNPDNLGGNDYNENFLNSDIDENIKEIFELISEHIKKIVIERKTSPHLAANILSSSLFNFNKDQRMISNLVAVLERKLSQKGRVSQVGMMTGGWGSVFNRKINYFKIFLILGGSTSGNMNMAMKSMISINKPQPSFNTSSNFNLKINDAGALNNFAEIE